MLEGIVTFSTINEIITSLGIRRYIKVITTAGISGFDSFIVNIKFFNDF